MSDPLICEKCGGRLETDDAVSVVKGVCATCRAWTMAPRRDDDAETFSSSEALLQDVALGEMFVSHGSFSPTSADIAEIDNLRISDSSKDSVERELPAAREMTLRKSKAHISVVDRRIEPPKAGRALHPPILPFVAEPSLRHRRRRRDLFVGSMIGLAVTMGLTGYILLEGCGRDALPIERVRQAAKLDLRVSPASATVRLDGAILAPPDASGRLALEFAEGEPGEHWLDVAADGYQSVRRPLSMYRGAPEAIIELVRQPLELIAQTIPPGAEIWVNGELRGVTPASLRLAVPDPIELEFRKAGYSAVNRLLNRKEIGDRIDLSLALQKIGPLLSVVTDPPGASIIVGGEPVGAAPLEFELDPIYLGRNVRIEASLEGYDHAGLSIPLPQLGGGDPASARLALAPAIARIEIRTEPPGGLVMLAGKRIGWAPVTLEFEPEQVGLSIVVEAVLGGTHFGRREMKIPPPGPPVPSMISLAPGEGRVVFAAALPLGMGTARRALTERLVNEIHKLGGSQRFAVIACTDRGMEAWPGGLELAAASGQQKIRAYDMVRSLRPTRAIDLDQLLQASLALEPTTVRLFTDGSLDRRAFERFGLWIEKTDVRIHVVRARRSLDEAWLEKWAAAHDATLTLLDADAPAGVAIVESED